MKIDTNLMLLGGASLAALMFFGSKSSKASPTPGPTPTAGKKVSLVPGKSYQIELEGHGGFTFNPSKLDDNKSVLESVGLSVKSASLKDPEHLSLVVTATKNTQLVVGLMYQPDPSQPTTGFTYTSVREVQNVP